MQILGLLLLLKQMATHLLLQNCAFLQHLTIVVSISVLHSKMTIISASGSILNNTSYASMSPRNLFPLSLYLLILFLCIAVKFKAEKALAL